MPPSGSKWKSLLVIKPSSLGDIVHGLQVVQSFARQQPECRIAWVARDRFAPLVEAAPFVHETLHYRRKEGWRGLWNLLRALRRRDFDLVWDMQGLLRSGLMTAAANAPEKWGRSDNREGAGLFYRGKAPLPSGPGPHHAVPVLQGFLRAAGLDETVDFPLRLRPGKRFGWQPFFDDAPERVFVIFVDSRGAEKEWKYFDELTRLIWERIPGSRVAWCAGQPTEPKSPAPEGRFLNLCGCPLDEMMELVRQPSIFIGNDSGPMHLSAAVENPVLAIFGPTSPLRFGPWPPDARDHLSIQAPGGVLADLNAEAVFGAVQELRGRL